MEAETVSWPFAKVTVARRGGLCAGVSGGVGVSVGAVAGIVCGLCSGDGAGADWPCRVAVSKSNASVAGRVGIGERMRLRPDYKVRRAVLGKVTRRVG